MGYLKLNEIYRKQLLGYGLNCKYICFTLYIYIYILFLVKNKSIYVLLAPLTNVHGINFCDLNLL